MYTIPAQGVYGKDGIIMRLAWQKAVCVLLAVFLLTGSAVLTADAANQYRRNRHWQAVTAERAVQMYEQGESFILYCYRATCSNCQTVGNQLLTEWMDGDGTDVCGLSVDGVGGIPDFVFSVRKSRTLPFVAFVRDGQVLSFSKEGTLDEYMQTLRNVYAVYREGGLLQNRLTVITLPDVLRYPVGAEPDYTGLVLRADYTDGRTQTVTQGYTVSDVSTDTPGRKTVTVTYDGIQTSFDIRVDTPDGTPAVRIMPLENAEIRFGRTLTLSADTDNMPPDARITWRCGVRAPFAAKTLTGEGDTFSVTASGVPQTVAVYASITAPDGSVFAETQQSVRFDNGLQSRFLYWLEMLRYSWADAVDGLLRAASVFAL